MSEEGNNDSRLRVFYLRDTKSDIFLNSGVPSTYSYFWPNYL